MAGTYCVNSLRPHRPNPQNIRKHYYFRTSRGHYTSLGMRNMQNLQMII